jgi:Tol biopolymer transport system component
VAKRHQRAAGYGLSVVAYWSPDGTTLAYTRGRPYQNAEVYSIWHVNPDGTCPEALLAGRPRGNWYASPVWSPGRPTRRPKRLRC